jgi:hypothetical protein
MIAPRSIYGKQIYFFLLCILVLGWNLTLYDSVIMPSVPSMMQGNDIEQAGKETNATHLPMTSVTAISTTRTFVSPWLWYAGTPERADDDQCDLAMSYIRQLNECRGECAMFHNISKPLLHWAVMGGQGMGRFIDNAVYTCLRAASLGRPCLVDSTLRDPFYTLRSFLSMPLDVDVMAEAENDGSSDSALTVFSKKEALELQDALLRLKHPGSGHWTVSDFLSASGGHPNDLYRHILPLIEPSSDHPNISGNSASDTTIVSDIMRHSDRIAISPSWGPPSLWTKDPNYELIPPILTADVARDNSPYSCQRGDDRLITKLQNYMFRPTKLSKELYMAYRRRVLGNDSQSHVDHLPYGSIHIRYHILRTTYKAFPPIDADSLKIQDAIRDMATTLWKRMDKEQAKNRERFQGIKHWWIVSDNMHYSRSLAQTLNEMALAAKSELYFVTDGMSNKVRLSELPNSDNATTTHPDIDALLNKILAHRQSSVKPHHVIGSKEGTIHHSVDPDATGIFGQQYMATSIIDWMVLHESHCAIVTIGSFGASGARGRNKVPVNPDKARYRFYLKP